MKIKNILAITAALNIRKIIPKKKTKGKSRKKIKSRVGKNCQKHHNHNIGG